MPIKHFLLTHVPGYPTWCNHAGEEWTSDSTGLAQNVQCSQPCPASGTSSTYFVFFSHVPVAWFAKWFPLSKHHCALKGIDAVYNQACEQFMLWCFDFWYGLGCHRKDHQQFGTDSMHCRFQYRICSGNLSYAYILVSSPKALISLNKHYSGIIVYIFFIFIYLHIFSAE